MEYVKIQKGNTGLIYNGFKYVVNRKTASKTFWRYSDRKCLGSVTTEGTTVKNNSQNTVTLQMKPNWKLKSLR